MAARRQHMDVDAIRRAVNQRLDQLELKNEELRRRMVMVREGTSSKIIDLLVNDRPKKYFERPILRAASIALEWPANALERIEAGEVDPDELEHVPWVLNDAEPADRVESVEGQLDQLRAELSETRSEVGDLRVVLDDLTKAVLRMITDPDDEAETETLRRVEEALRRQGPADVSPEQQRPDDPR